MKLVSAKMVNYRSIKDGELDFDPSCKVLVGINESGKSNILKALSLLDPSTKTESKDDLRDALPNEPRITEAYVRFVFDLDNSDLDELMTAASPKVLSKDTEPKIVNLAAQTLTLRGFFNRNNQALYTADIIKGTKAVQRWSWKGYSLRGKWLKPSAACPPDYKLGEVLMAGLALIDDSSIAGVPAEYFEEATIDDFFALAGGTITSYAGKKLPQTIFWEYDEDDLLPASVAIEEFAADPNTCPALKNMFLLAGITDIQASIADAKKGSPNQFQNFFNGVANKTTAHFRSVWKEYKDIKFSLRLNADNVVPGVEESNTHDFARRSDGFKRFVCFLLMISVNVKSHALDGALLLIDEPDISLHPSGARYLRDELIKISRTNSVVYSTHSIFMIDSGNLGRHYIVKKHKEVTSAVSAETSNIADEEVLYNALGYTVFDILKEKNIIFEGWRDKKLFQVASDSASKALKKSFKDIGKCHATGVKNIAAITPLIELAGRKCLIISDSDKPAKEQQRLYRQQKGFGDWKTYQELDSKIKAVTGEDFVKNDRVLKLANKLMTKNKLPKMADSDLPAESGKLAAVQGWLAKNSISGKQAEPIIKELKDAIFDGLKAGDIEAAYTDLMKAISVAL